MGKAILKITDGTIQGTVDLLSPVYGYLLCDWRPSRPNPVVTSNKDFFTGADIPSYVTHDSAVDTFTLNARDGSQDRLIADERKLINLLRKAPKYWTGDQTVVSPVYIEARARDETTTRYAVILSSEYHDSSNPYAQPFASIKPASTDLVIAITHDGWTSIKPGNEGFAGVYAGQWADGYNKWTGYRESMNRDNHPGDQKQVAVTNYIAQATIDHILIPETATSPQYDATTLPSSQTYELFPVPLTPGDWTYFGSETYYNGVPFPPIQEQQKFNNVIIHAQEGTFESVVLEAQIWFTDGMAEWWEDVELYQKPHGDNFVYYFDSYNMAETELFGYPLGSWVRMRRVSDNGEYVVPIVNPYTVTSNHISIEESNIGDFGTRVDLEFHAHEVANNTNIGLYYDNPTTVAIGYRSRNRNPGALSPPNNIRAHLRTMISPADATQPFQPTGALWSHWDVRDSSYGKRNYNTAASQTSPTGYYFYRRYLKSEDVGNDGWSLQPSIFPLCRISLRDEQYTGKFRVFLRFETRGTMPPNFSLYGQYGTRSQKGSFFSSSDGTYILGTMPTVTYNQFNTKLIVYDGGVVDLSNRVMARGNLLTFQFIVIPHEELAWNTNYYVYDLVLIPVDEFFIEIDFEYGLKFPKKISLLSGQTNGLFTTDLGYYTSLFGSTEYVSLSSPIVSPRRIMHLDMNGEGAFYFFAYNKHGGGGWGSPSITSDLMTTLDCTVNVYPMYMSSLGDLT